MKEKNYQIEKEKDRFETIFSDGDNTHKREISVPQQISSHGLKTSILKYNESDPKKFRQKQQDKYTEMLRSNSRFSSHRIEEEDQNKSTYFKGLPFVSFNSKIQQIQQAQIYQIEESPIAPLSSRNIIQQAWPQSLSNFGKKKNKNSMSFSIYFKTLKAVRQFKSFIILKQIPLKAIKFIRDLSYVENLSGSQSIIQQGTKKNLFATISGQSSKLVRFQRALRLEFTKIILYLLNLLDKYLPVIDPFHYYKIFFDIILIIAVIFSVFCNTIEVFFAISFDELYPSSFSLIRWLIIILFLVNIFLNLNTGTYKKGIITKSRTDICSFYFQDRIVSDMLSIISLYHFPIQSYGVSIFKLFILFKVPLVTSKLDLAMQVTQTIKSYSQLYHIIRLTKLLLTILLVAHFVAICFYGQALLFDTINPDMISWIKISKLVSLDDIWIKKYVFSLYFSVTTMVTVGYGDITPVNGFEAGFVIISMVIASGIFAYTFNLIGSIISDMTKKQKLFQKKLSMLNIYLTDRNIEPDLSYQVQKFLEYKFQSDQMLSKQEEEKVLSDLSTNLLDRINFQAKKKVINKGINIFSIFSQEMRDKICLELKEYRPSKDEIIFEQEVVYDDPKMYFIHRGSVDISHKVPGRKESESLVLSTLVGGQFFGEMSFLTNIPRSSSAKACESSILYSLSQSDLLRVVQTDNGEYEKFFMQNQKLIFNNSFSTIQSQCYCCQKETHSIKNCPLIHYRPDKELMILKQNYSVPTVDRIKFVRIREKQNSLFRLLEKKLAANKFRHNFKKMNNHFFKKIDALNEEHPQFEEKVETKYNEFSNTFHIKTIQKIQELHQQKLRNQEHEDHDNNLNHFISDHSSSSNMSNESQSQNSLTSITYPIPQQPDHLNSSYNEKKLNKSNYEIGESIPEESHAQPYYWQNTNQNNLSKITSFVGGQVSFYDTIFKTRSKTIENQKMFSKRDSIIEKKETNSFSFLNNNNNNNSHIPNILHYSKDLEDSYLNFVNNSKELKVTMAEIINDKESIQFESSPFQTRQNHKKKPTFYRKQSSSQQQIAAAKNNQYFFPTQQSSPEQRKMNSCLQQQIPSRIQMKKNITIFHTPPNIDFQDEKKEQKCTIIKTVDPNSPHKQEKEQFIFENISKFDEHKEFEFYFPQGNYKNIIQCYNKTRIIHNQKLPPYFGVYSFINRKDRKMKNRSSFYECSKKMRSINE